MTYIDKTYDMSKYHLFKSGGLKSYLSDATISKLKKSIKENIKSPSKNRKVYVISFFIKPESENPLRIVCGQYTLTTKLALVMEDDDVSLTIKYTKDELEKYGFKKEDIVPLGGIKEIKNAYKLVNPSSGKFIPFQWRKKIN